MNPTDTNIIPCLACQGTGRMYQGWYTMTMPFSAPAENRPIVTLQPDIKNFIREALLSCKISYNSYTETNRFKYDVDKVRIALELLETVSIVTLQPCQTGSKLPKPTR